MRSTGLAGRVAMLVLCAGIRTGADAAVPLPYAISRTNTVDWTTLPGWTGNVTSSTAGGSARFDAAGRTLTLELDGAPTALSFTLRGYSNSVGTAPASFIVEQSGGGMVWNSTLVADISEESLSLATMPFGPFPLESSTRFIRFTYADFFAYDIGLNNVTVDGGPAEPRVVFTDREDGFIVAQGAENEIISASVINGGGYWFGFPALGIEPWESDNNGTFKTDSPRDVYTINTSVTGAFHATANGFTDNTDDLLVAGTIHFSVAPAHAVDLQVGSNGTATVQVNGQEATQAPAGAVVTVLPVPDPGFATDTIRLNGGAIEGTTFVMPGEAAVVEVSFREKLAGEPTLILSQYYEGSGDNKWIELYNPGAVPVDLDAAGYRLGLWQNAGREGWKTGTAPAIATVLTGTVAPGSTYLVSHGAAAAPAYAVANVASNGLIFNGDDSVVLYTGTEYNFANVVDAIGLLSNTAANCSLVRAPTICCGVHTDFDADDWIRFEYTAVDTADVEVPERLGWHGVAQPQPTNPPTLSNLGHSPAAIVFEIPTNYTDYTVHGAASLSPGTAAWAGSSIVDQCSTELAGNNTRITVPTTFGPKQIIWLTIPAAD
ncbi:MAG TPA: lamin tail domain-containing protein [Kiritimatiellia bacterium]|nr:lamin tail domain-containing protein [Kiritimatiellia bacterium]